MSLLKQCREALLDYAQRRLIKVEAINAVRDPKIKTNHIKESTISQIFLAMGSHKGQDLLKAQVFTPDFGYLGIPIGTQSTEST